MLSRRAHGLFIAIGIYLFKLETSHLLPSFTLKSEQMVLKPLDIRTDTGEGALIHE